MMRLTVLMMMFAMTMVLMLAEGQRHHEGKAIRVKMKGKPRCKYDRNAVWSECGPGVEHREKVMLLKPGQRQSCPPTRTKVKRCKDNKNKVEKHKKRGRGGACKYRRGHWSECDPRTKTRSRTLTLWKGTVKECRPTITITRRCTKACKYRRGYWSECDPRTKTRSRTLTLWKGNVKECRPTITITKKCGKACKYRRGHWSECDPRTKTHSRTLTLWKGNVNECRPTITITRRCTKACKYRRGYWSECDPRTKTRSRTLTLWKGNVNKCRPTITITRRCTKACKYRRGHWSECDPQTKTRNRTLTLRKGNVNKCRPTKIITRKCRKGPSHPHRACKYHKGPWMPCNQATQLRSRELTLKKGDPTHCNTTRIITKPCRRRGAFTSARISRCKYRALPWGDCDSRTNTRTRILQLKSGDAMLCQTSKRLTRKCHKPCKFSKGNWSECDLATGLKLRIDHLKKGDRSQCETKRVISKVCGKGEGCKYETGEWGECDPQTQQRARTKKLVKGDPQVCQAERTAHRPCKAPNGEDNCFLGKWGSFGPCQNGVMIKRRRVIAGGVECERKAVKTKPCS